MIQSHDGRVHRRAFCQAHVTSLLLLACGAPALSANAPLEQQIHGYDASPSFRAHLGAAALLSCRTIDRSRPAKLTQIRFEHSAVTFSDTAFYPKGRTLLKQTVSQLRDPAPPVTRQEEFWRLLLGHVSHSRSQTIRIFLWTDGEADNLRADPQIRQAVALLARNRRVRLVAMIGVRRGSWDRLRQNLAAFGDRLQFLGEQQLTPQAVAALADHQ